MNQEKLAELLTYIQLGDKLRCAYVVSKAFGMTPEESQEWCGKWLFPMLEEVRNITDRSRSPKG